MAGGEPRLDELLAEWRDAERQSDAAPLGSLERAVAEDDVKEAHEAYQERLAELEPRIRPELVDRI
jgi:hypothetical protein